MNKIIGLLTLLVLVWACDSNAVYKGYEEIPEAEWYMENVKSFEFTLADNSNPLTMNYLVRNAVDYPFYNLYLRATLKDSTGKVLVTGMDQLILFNEKTGKPVGDGLGDLFDQKVTASKFKAYQFPYKGKYTIELQQNMRPDPLLGVLGVGFELIDPSKVAE